MAERCSLVQLNWGRCRIQFSSLGQLLNDMSTRLLAASILSGHKQNTSSLTRFGGLRVTEAPVIGHKCTFRQRKDPDSNQEQQLFSCMEFVPFSHTISKEPRKIQ